MSVRPATLRQPVRAPFAFNQIVCAVDDSLCAHEAVQQATQLAGPVDTLTFVAVTGARGADGATRSTLDEGHAAEAVEAAWTAAHDAGVEATTVIVHAQDVSGAILHAARDAGLLVVGANGQSRVASILLGGTATRAVHSSPVPVLVARGRPELGFPGVVLVGSQGVEDRHTAIVAATIAARHDTRVVLAHAGRSGSALQQALNEQAGDVRDITGQDPVVMRVDGPPVDRLPAMASSIGAGLVVLGSHGRRGPRAIAGLSEHVAHRTACSVVVLRENAVNGR